uniref:Secreted protein n=1 Tax=Angiostrongylus cantonensis TaxID=6313 RepID=A0A0K0D719_ANGCA
MNIFVTSITVAYNCTKTEVDTVVIVLPTCLSIFLKSVLHALIITVQYYINSPSDTLVVLKYVQMMKRKTTH